MLPHGILPRLLGLSKLLSTLLFTLFIVVLPRGVSLLLLLGSLGSLLTVDFVSLEVFIVLLLNFELLFSAHFRHLCLLKLFFRHVGVWQYWLIWLRCELVLQGITGSWCLVSSLSFFLVFKLFLDLFVEGVLW